MPGALREFSANVKLDLDASRLEALQGILAPHEGLRLEGGSAGSTIEAAFRDGVANGKVSVAVRNGVVRTRKYRLRGQANLEVPLRRWDVLKRPYDVSGTRVALTDVYSSGADEARGWWGRVEIPSGQIGATTFAKVDVRCRDARPLLALLGVDLPGWANALVKLDDFSASATVAAAPGTVRVKDFDARGGGFHIEGEFTRDSAGGSGALLIEKGILILGVDIAPTKTTVRPLFAKQWYAKQKARAAGGG